MGVAYSNGQSANGTCTVIAPAGPNVCWNLTSLSVSMAGNPAGNPNGKVTVFDGAVGTTVIFAEFLPGTGSGSVGATVECKIPKGPNGNPSLQGTPGNAMTIVVTGTGTCQVSVNARFTDGLSQ